MKNVAKNNQNIEKSLSLAELEIIYKTKVKTSEMPIITNSKDAFNEFIKIFNPSRIAHSEEMLILCLNRSNRVLGWFRVSSGGISGTVVDIRVILQVALNTNSSSVIVAHNHPSGNTRPSDADTEITKRIKNALEMVDIKLLDHLIITPDENYLSMQDEGIII